MMAQEAGNLQEPAAAVSNRFLFFFDRVWRNVTSMLLSRGMEVDDAASHMLRGICNSIEEDMFGMLDRSFYLHNVQGQNEGNANNQGYIQDEVRLVVSLHSNAKVYLAITMLLAAHGTQFTS